MLCPGVGIQTETMWFMDLNTNAVYSACICPRIHAVTVGDVELRSKQCSLLLTPYREGCLHSCMHTPLPVRHTSCVHNAPLPVRYCTPAMRMEYPTARGVCIHSFLQDTPFVYSILQGGACAHVDTPPCEIQPTGRCGVGDAMQNAGVKCGSLTP
jgi:hypothetical protein